VREILSVIIESVVALIILAGLLGLGIAMFKLFPLLIAWQPHGC
jgi:hypothetical protein